MSKLQHRTIMVTRPAGLETNQLSLLSAEGADCIHYPAIEIAPPADNSGRQHARDHFDEFDIAIFISPTAVKQTLAFMDIDAGSCALAAIGSRSQRALEQAGLEVSIKPDGHDSESLLQHPRLQAGEVEGKHIIIFRGEDGRDVLADNLRERGADVFYAAMYSRRLPPAAPMLDEAMLAPVDAITISSNEGLQNLYDLAAGDTGLLLSKILVVPGARAEKLAGKLGFTNIIRADNATDEAIVDALIHKAFLSSTP